MNFVHTVRIYWEDTDAGGIVFYANFLKFFERARTEWLRSLHIEQNALKRSLGQMFVVSETHVKYLAPAVLDDELQIHTTITERGKSSLVLDQKAYKFVPLSVKPTERGAITDVNNYNGELSFSHEYATQAARQQLICAGSVRLGWINAQTGRPTRIPSFIQDVL